MDKTPPLLFMRDIPKGKLPDSLTVETGTDLIEVIKFYMNKDRYSLKKRGGKPFIQEHWRLYPNGIPISKSKTLRVYITDKVKEKLELQRSKESYEKEVKETNETAFGEDFMESETKGSLQTYHSENSSGCFSKNEDYLKHLEQYFQPEIEKHNLSVWHSGGGNWHFRLDQSSICWGLPHGSTFYERKWHMVINPLKGDGIDSNIMNLTDANNQPVAFTFDDDDQNILIYEECSSLILAIKRFQRLCMYLNSKSQKKYKKFLKKRKNCYQKSLKNEGGLERLY